MSLEIFFHLSNKKNTKTPWDEGNEAYYSGSNEESCPYKGVMLDDYQCCGDVFHDQSEERKQWIDGFYGRKR